MPISLREILVGGGSTPKHAKRLGPQSPVNTKQLDGFNAQFDANAEQNVQQYMDSLAVAARAEIDEKPKKVMYAKRRMAEATARIGAIKQEAIDVLKPAQNLPERLSSNEAFWTLEQKTFDDASQMIVSGIMTNFDPVMYDNKKPHILYKKEHGDNLNDEVLLIFEYDKEGQLKKEIRKSISLRGDHIISATLYDGNKTRNYMYRNGDLTRFTEKETSETGAFKERSFIFSNLADRQLKLYSSKSYNPKTDNVVTRQLYRYDKNAKVQDYTKSTYYPTLPKIRDNVERKFTFMNGELFTAQYRTRLRPDVVGEYFIDLGKSGCEYCTGIKNEDCKDIKNPYLSMFEKGAVIDEVISFDFADGKFVPTKYAQGITNTDGTPSSEFEYIVA